VSVRLALVVFAVGLVTCGGALPAAAPPPPRLVHAAPAEDLAVGQDEVAMEIIELMCRPCASQIVGDARLLPGVTSVHMELATKTLTLRFDTGITQRDRVIASVERIVAQVQ
jgi:copper chaperone CopZ